MALESFGKIEGLGIYQGHVFQDPCEPLSLINIVFAPNGSGKSTLARGLYKRSISPNPEEEPGSIVLNWGSGGKEAFSGEAGNGSHWSRIRVFNRDFIADNLYFSDDTPSGAAPLLTLGEGKVKLDQQRPKLDAELSELKADIESTTRRMDLQVLAIQTITRNIARELASRLASIDAKWNPRSYNRKSLEGIMSVMAETGFPRSPDVIHADDCLLDQIEMPEAHIYFPEVDRIEELGREISELVARDGAVSDYLSDHPSAVLAWIRTGLELHKGETECHFCSSSLAPDRVELIEEYFDGMRDGVRMNLEELQNRGKSESERIRIFLAAIDDFGGEVAGLNPSLTSVLREASNSWRSVADEVARWMESLAGFKETLKATQVQLEGSFDLFAAARDDLNMAQVAIALHNDKARNFEKERLAAAHRIELDAAFRAIEETRASRHAVKEDEEHLSDLRASSDAVRETIARLEREAASPFPLAEQLTEDVAALLGREEFKFEVLDDRYVLMRQKEPAASLSEGEITAISLAYFLRSLEVDAASWSVAVIDDPVSSLDHKVSVGVWSLLWRRFHPNEGDLQRGLRQEQRKQLVLLTHNFEHFSRWRYKALNRKFARMFEIRSVVSDEAAQRTPQLSAIADDVQGLHSQYHYLFWRVANSRRADSSSLEGQFDLSFVATNCARRLLESFMAFRVPHEMGNFTASVPKLCSDAGVSQDVAHRLTTFLHGGSHLEEVAIHGAPEVGEASAILAAVLEFIKAADPDHYWSMLLSVGIIDTHEYEKCAKGGAAPGSGGPPPWVS